MILYGASGHGKVIAEILEKNGINDIVFWDDTLKPNIWDYAVSTPAFGETKKEVIISIGINSIRKVVAERIKEHCIFITGVHPDTVISPRAIIDEGTVVMGGVVINTDTKIGKHCIINSGAVIEHDCIIEDFVHVSPNATLCGSVTVGEGAHIGAGAVVIQGIKIGKWCNVGAGAVVIRDMPNFSTGVGNPCRVIKVSSAE